MLYHPSSVCMRGVIRSTLSPACWTGIWKIVFTDPKPLQWRPHPTRKGGTEFLSTCRMHCHTDLSSFFVCRMRYRTDLSSFLSVKRAIVPIWVLFVCRMRYRTDLSSFLSVKCAIVPVRGFLSVKHAIIPNQLFLSVVLFIKLFSMYSRV